MEIKRKYHFSLKPYGKKKDYFLIRIRDVKGELKVHIPNNL